MEHTDKTETEDTYTSRRQVLASVGGGFATSLGGLLGETNHQNISLSTDSIIQGMMQRNSHLTTAPHSRRSQKPAYVALPGVSMMTLLSNLPYILNDSTEQMPVILMDTLDYSRLQTWGATGTVDPGTRNAALAYGTLHRRGVIQLVDYADFYSKYKRRNTLRRNRAVIEELTDDTLQRVAVRAANGWVGYGRGTYQEPFRASLGREVDRFKKARRIDEKRRRKLDRGLSAPSKWNERVLNRQVAALHIRQYADDVLDLDVRGVVGQGESATIGGILAATETAPSTASHIRDLNPMTHFSDYTSEMVTPTREGLDIVDETATQIADVQHTDWVTIGSSLAIPQYHNLFNMDVIEEQIQDGMDTNALAEEATRIVTTLQQRTEDGPSPNKLSYETEWIAEQATTPLAGGETQSWGLTEMADYAVNLSQYSRELRSLVEHGDVSQAAALVAASVISDPVPYDEYPAIYQRGENLIARLDPPLVDETHLKAARRRGAAWDEHPDWYETAEQVR